MWKETKGRFFTENVAMMPHCTVILCLCVCLPRAPQAGTPGAKGLVAFLSSEFVVKPRVGVVFIIVLSVEQANVPTQLEW